MGEAPASEICMPKALSDCIMMSAFCRREKCIAMDQLVLNNFSVYSWYVCSVCLH